MSKWKVSATDYDTRLDIGKTIGNESKTEGSLERLQSLFHDRFQQMKKMMYDLRLNNLILKKLHHLQNSKKSLK